MSRTLNAFACLACAAVPLWATSAAAFHTGLAVGGRDVESNGFVAQGFVLSEGNNVFGESTDGTFQYFELGVNGTLNLGHGLVLSAQEVVRRAGQGDRGKLRLDYAFIDYRFLSDPALSAGLRAGRVKNYFGLYNDARDVVFTRPGILLPDSVYSDITGQQRGLLFSTDGGQLYADGAWGPNDFSFAVTAGADRKMSPGEKQLFFDLGGLPFEIDVKDFIVGRLHDSLDGGRWVAAVSYLGATTLASTPPSVALSADINIDSYVGSLAFNGERTSVTLEYTQQHTEGSVLFAGTVLQSLDSWSEGAYLQADYRLLPEWTVMARLDAAFENRGDYDGRDCESGAPPRDRHECFSVDAVAGVEWRPNSNWGVWAEYHQVHGVFAKYARLDNDGRTPDYHWNIVLLMAGYRF